MYCIQWRVQRENKGAAHGVMGWGGAIPIPAVLGKYLIWTEYNLMNNHRVCFILKNSSLQ